MGDRVFITPLAKKLAILNSIDLKDISGSGPRGRITKYDIEKHSDSVRANKNMNPEGAKNNDDILEHELIDISNLRKIIAQKLVLSKTTIPHFYLRRKVKMDELIQFRSRANISLEKSKKISINDFFIKACGCALVDYPECNIVWKDTHMFKFKEAAIGLAISTESGLYTPTIRHIEKKSISLISSEVKELIKKAKDKQLRSTDFVECAHAISNLGMFSIENFDAIINPPNSSILAVGAIKEEVISENGNFSSCKRLSLTLSVDHRTIDGELGSKFLDRIIFYLENPAALMVS